jgi:hypothetical protein
MTEEQKQKISMANKGKKRTDDIKQKLSDIQNKRYELDINREKLRIAQNKRYENPIERMKHSRPGELNPNFGKPISEEQKKKISEAHKGKRLSNETKSKMSASRKGVPKSEEHKLKIKMAQLGRKKTPEQNEINRKAQTGKRASPETLLKMSIAFSKENNPAWKGGITPLNHLIRTNTKMDEWKLAVFKRDNYTCQLSGERGCTLAAHHIINFSHLIAENNITSLEEALKCDALWDTNNGITLSKKEHDKLHQENGGTRKNGSSISLS